MTKDFKVGFMPRARQLKWVTPPHSPCDVNDVNVVFPLTVFTDRVLVDNGQERPMPL